MADEIGQTEEIQKEKPIVTVTGTRDDNMNSIFLSGILEIIEEGDKEDTFAGFQILERRDSEGRLVAAKLILCDNLHGIIAPRCT